MSLPPIMTAAQWAEVLQCSTKTVKERMRRGDLPGLKIGDPWVCPTEAMLRRLNEMATKEMGERRQDGRLADLKTPAQRTPPELPSLQ